MRGARRAESVEGMIGRMVRRIVRRFHPDKIILFGSQARGTAAPGSDVDLLVVLPVAGAKRQVRLQLAVALGDIALPKDILVATPEEFECQQDIVGTIACVARREGKILYARSN